MRGSHREIAAPLASWLLFILLSGGAFWTDVCEGASTIPGEGRQSFLYVITHLHPFVYLILFLIFVLSVINLIVQGWDPLGSWPFFGIGNRSAGRRKSGHGSHGRGPQPTRPDLPGKAESPKAGHGPSGRGGAEEGIVGVRRVDKGLDRGMAVSMPTPMEGVNHSLPQFAPPVGSQTGTPRILERESDQKPPAQEFKFSSAVDVVSQIEIERREKEQLVVSGTVTGPDGQGIPSVMVYLTDAEGNRVGQSSRSGRDTGEFKVLVNEPGQYVLNGYKRGFIMESGAPLVLPIETGKIEGFNFRMMPEGCLVRGRVLADEETMGAPNLEVRCICAGGAFSRTDRTDQAGEFRIAGVPQASKCVIEVSGAAGEVLGRSVPFETLRKKEIYRKVSIPSLPLADETSAVGLDSAAGWEEEKEDPAKPAHSPAVGSIPQT